MYNDKLDRIHNRLSSMNKDPNPLTYPNVTELNRRNSIMTEWIKCSDQMPPDGNHILAYARALDYEDFEIIKCRYFITSNNRHPYYEFIEQCGCKGISCNEMYIEEVSHWMPLPPIPEV